MIEALLFSGVTLLLFTVWLWQNSTSDVQKWVADIVGRIIAGTTVALIYLYLQHHGW